MRNSRDKEPPKPDLCPVAPECPVGERRAEYLSLEPRIRELEEILVGEDGRGGLLAKFDRMVLIARTVGYILAGILLLLFPIAGNALAKLLGG